MRAKLLLWLAQGLGSGRMPVAPGTFGSVIGLGWFAVLLLGSSPLFFVIGIILGLGISVIVCGKAEKILGQKDPSSVVFDEIAAVPICYASWAALLYFKSGSWPRPGFFFQGETLLWTIGVFIAFRICDIVKPWPVRQSQGLPGGWGITVDDLLAAGYVNLCLVLFHFSRELLLFCVSYLHA